MSYLCITVELLDPLFHGKSDDDRPEWPPSPLRLYQALLAGARAACRDAEWNDQKAAAFRWLETLPPPTIVAPEADFTCDYTVFVPNNDGDKEPDRQGRLTGKLVQPHRLRNGIVQYLWRLESADEGSGHVTVVCREARNLLALGWGLDQAIADGRVVNDYDAAALPGVRWWPFDVASGAQWRVPVNGSLDDLSQVHAAFRNRLKQGIYNPPRPVTAFRTVRYVPHTQTPPRPYVTFILEGKPFEPGDTVRAAAMLRSAMCREENRADYTQQFADDSETYLAGHNTNHTHAPRFSYLPLPTIGHRHADGLIRRFMIAATAGDNAERTRWAEQRLNGVLLTDHNGHGGGRLAVQQADSVVARYVDTAHAWASVTPVVLPGHDDFRSDRGRPAKAERLLLKAMQQSGVTIANISDIALRKAPFWPGSQHPRLYHRPDYLRSYSCWHVQLVFREPMEGPIAIGAGRHCGLGLFAGVNVRSSRHAPEARS